MEKINLKLAFNLIYKKCFKNLDKFFFEKVPEN